MKTEKIKKQNELARSNILIKQSWEAYKKNFAKLFAISAIFFGLMGIATTLISPDIIEYQQQINLVGKIKPVLIISTPQYSLLILAVFLFSVLGQASLISALKKIPAPWQLKKTIEQGSKIFWPFLLVSILSGIVIALGFILFIIPGIVFMVWYAFATYVLVFEEIRGWSALKRSKELVKGYWWPIFGRLMVLVLISIAASIVVNWIPYIGPLALQILLPPFSTAYAVMLYKGLKEIKKEQ